MKSRVDGPIIKVAFTEGQAVKQDDPLFQIDPRPYQAALELSEATKTKDEAQLQTAEGDLDRYGRLVGSGFQTRQSFDQQKGLVAQLMATIKGDEAQIDTARLNLSFTDIRSPITGRLGARLVDIGNLVHANDNTALVTVSQLQPIFVSFTLPQASLDRIRHNQQQAPLEVVALSDDDNTQIAVGQLTLIDNAIDEATGTIHLKGTFANSDERLWPGEFVNTRLVLRMRHNVPTVPLQTVQPGPNGYFAYVIGANDTVKRRAVEVAAMQDGLAVIRKGLTAGQRVVVAGRYPAHRRRAGEAGSGEARRDRTAMSISQPFIHRPIATSLLSLGILVFGIVAYTLLPVAALPNVDYPTITVTASYPGASPATMASAVATPLEQQFTAIPSLEQMTSLSGTGTTMITLQFDLSRNIDGAAQDVQTAINAAGGLLPKDLPSPPTYRKTNPAELSGADLRGLFRCAAGQSA